MSQPEPRRVPRYGGYVGLLAVLILVLITINTIVTKPNGVRGLAPGEQMPPFAVPLALGNLHGDADTATRRRRRRSRAACPRARSADRRSSTSASSTNGAPVVLALFVDGGSCPAVLERHAGAVGLVPRRALRGGGDQERSRADLRRADPLARPDPAGRADGDGALAALYKVATCPQVTFAYPGGEVQSKALLTRPSRATLRPRVAELVAAARARGWKQPPPAGGVTR